MENTRENAEKFIHKFTEKNSPNWLSGIPDLIDILTEYGNQLGNKYIPNNSHSVEVFSIKDSEDSPSGKQAFIGYKLENDNFHFIGVPYTGEHNITEIEMLELQQSDKNGSDWFNSYQDVDDFLFKELDKNGLEFVTEFDDVATNTIESIKRLIGK